MDRGASGGDGARGATGVKLDSVADKPLIDKRFERERAYKSTSIAGASESKVVSSTFDAFQRMAAGLDGRTIADKISDPNRPTWEQYKKDNEDKLDLRGVEIKKMAEYRAELDKERERRLKGSKIKEKKVAISSSDDSDSESDSGDSTNAKKKKKNKERKKKKEKEKKRSKKHKKEKKRKRDNETDSDSESNRKKNKKESNGESVRLSDFLKGNHDDSD